MYLKDKVFRDHWRSFILSMFLLGTLITSANAQITIGGVVGVNQNQFTMPGTSIGVNAGAYGTYKITPLPYLSARMEILYSQEGGGRQDYSIPLSGSTLGDLTGGNIYSVKNINPYVYMHNLSIPLMLEVTLPEFQDADIMPKLLLGGSYAHMFGATELHTTQYTFIDQTFVDIPYEKENVGANYHADQWSLIAGMGIQFNGEKRDFAFDIRYRQGMTQLNRTAHSFSTIDGRLFSSTLSFNFSISIHKF